MRRIGMFGIEGQALPAIIFFLFGFSLLVAAVVVWIKAEDNSFAKAQNGVNDLKADVVLELKKITDTNQVQTQALSDLTIQMQHNYESLKTQDVKFDQRFMALELEIQRLKERQKILRHRMLPHLHTLTLKQDGPFQFELLRKGKPVGKTNPPKAPRPEAKGK